MVSKTAIFKKLQKKQALNHINQLFIETNNVLISDLGLAQRYIDLIRKLAMSFRIKLPREIKRSFCKHCYAVFPASARVRLQNKKVVKYCEKCRNFTRIPYK